MKLFIAETIPPASRRAHLSLAALMLGSMVAFVAGNALAQHPYPTPAAASEAFADALKRDDADALRTVLGADWKKFVPRDIGREEVDVFLDAWNKSHRIETASPERATLVVGDQDWTLPIPIVKTANGWQFDARAGADEMRTRRIGRNELAVMQAALAYCDAQTDYARVDRTNAGVVHYAQKFVSTPGQRDGLYWPVQPDEEQSPLGPLFTSVKRGDGYYGYHYKILQGQGKDAPGGAYDYRIRNLMVSGYALVAWPLRYGDTGIMSFMVSHDGQLYEKDLGEQSETIAQNMTTFNPDSSWNKVSPP